jgi:hypothetical protein
MIIATIRYIKVRFSCGSLTACRVVWVRGGDWCTPFVVVVVGGGVACINSREFIGAKLTHTSRYVFIAVPSLSLFQWHPFSVASAPDDKSGAVLYVKAIGRWTRSLRKLASETPDAAVTVLIDGQWRNAPLCTRACAVVIVVFVAVVVLVVGWQ